MSQFFKPMLLGFSCAVSLTANAFFFNLEQVREDVKETISQGVNTVENITEDVREVVDQGVISHGVNAVEDIRDGVREGVSNVINQGVAVSSSIQSQLPFDLNQLNFLSEQQLPEQLGFLDGIPQSAYNVLAASQKNFSEYYVEAALRYGEVPNPKDAAAANIRWLHNLVTTLALDKVTANPPDHFFQNIEKPKVPLVNRDVTMLDFENGYSKPHIPSMRWTRDGRIGLVTDIGGVDGNPYPLRFRLQKPEVLNENLVESDPGVHTVDLDTWVEEDYSKWGSPNTNLTAFASMCEPEAKNGVPANPYTCGVNGQDDCYDFTLIGAGVEETFNTVGNSAGTVGVEGGDRTLLPAQLEKHDRLFSREVTIRVENPKTSLAKIADVQYSQDYKVSPLRQGVLFETITPADSRIIVARRQFLPLVWKHTTTGQLHVGNYETVYSVVGEDASPCDVTEWGDLYPISHAPYDPRVKDKYLFAKYPFRDPMGNLVGDGKELKGTYPWIDKDAKLLSIMIGSANLFDGYIQQKSRFDNRCVYAGCTPRDVDGTADTTFAVIGGWTKGKAVVFDNMLNYTDFRLDMSNSLYLDLYEAGTATSYTDNKSHEVEAGASRSLAHTEPNSNVPVKDRYGYPVVDENGQQQTFLIKNTSIFDSIENRLNAFPHFRPVMPQDVVWTVNSGAATDELAFDDYLNDNAFIVSNMVAAYQVHNDNPFRMTAYDGWNKFYADFTGQVKVQNAATTLPDVWKVPSAGDVVNGRIEPVANGGVKGKGMYFNGNDTRISYSIPSNQPRDMASQYWHHSLFLDVRAFNKNKERIIFNFPDKSRVTMRGSNVKGKMTLSVYNNYGERIHSYDINKGLINKRWFNLALQVAPGSKHVTVFINGYPYHEFTVPNDASAFAMKPGTLALGNAYHQYDKRFDNFLDKLLNKSTQTSVNYKAFKGWLDEYKVFSYKPDYETACNFANGTLIAINENESGHWNKLAERVPPAMHSKISNALTQRGEKTYNRYMCFTKNFSKGKMANLININKKHTSIRTSMHFPEGPIYHDAPRPDSSKNEFCLSCHQPKDVPSLSIEALVHRNIEAKYDPRRQPLQPPAHITGNITPEFIQSIDGDWDAFGSNLIDEYILPSVHD